MEYNLERKNTDIKFKTFKNLSPADCMLQKKGIWTTRLIRKPIQIEERIWNGKYDRPENRVSRK